MDAISTPPSGYPRGVYLTILVAALGYFVDIYDLILFGIVRQASLTSLGVSGQALTDEGLFLLDVQMLGMLLGGILWGILGDRKGRLAVLFGSILLYSSANLCNAFVQDVNTYALLRFVAGIGLAGELGAGITLVSEILHPKHRGYGTTFVAALGLMGAVVASLVAGYQWDMSLFGWQLESWRVAYLVGGLMGLALLVMRVSLTDSEMYEATKQDGSIQRGNFLSLFRRWDSLKKYLACIAIGVPIWYIVGLLVFFSAEFGVEVGVTGGDVSVPTAIMLCYLGLSIGDITCGLISQWMASRKRAVALFMTVAALLSGGYLFLNGLNLTQFYVLCFALGFASGYWAIFVTIASEQFGTNIRATVTTTVPNFVRGMVNVINGSFRLLRPVGGMIFAAGIVGLVCFLVAFIALGSLKETYGKALNFNEK